ncbi:MAG: Trm112 family protein [Chloroflexi bacterium]|nr:Trm112 family protein [Chloroflexota bacterium]
MKTFRRLLGLGLLGALIFAALRLYRQYQEDSAFDLAPVGNLSNGSTPGGTKRTISKELLEILACPVDKGPVELLTDDSGKEWLVNRRNGYRYPVEDGIPIMLIEEGEKNKDESLISQ